jgi:hypothetical protein
MGEFDYAATSSYLVHKGIVDRKTLVKVLIVLGKHFEERDGRPFEVEVIDKPPPKCTRIVGCDKATVYFDSNWLVFVHCY